MCAFRGPNAGMAKRWQDAKSGWIFLDFRDVFDLGIRESKLRVIVSAERNATIRGLPAFRHPSPMQVQSMWSFDASSGCLLLSWWSDIRAAVTLFISPDCRFLVISKKHFCEKMCFMACWLVVCGLAFCRAENAESENGLAEFLSAHCSKCHNDKEKKGGIDPGGLREIKLENAQHWKDVIDNLQRGDMPPPEEAQPSAAARQEFLNTVRNRLDRILTDSGSRDFRVQRLTNQQIAWSWRELLQIDRDYSGDLIEDPVGKHGESLQSTLELTGGHMDVYLTALQRAVQEAIPDLNHAPKLYQLQGNDWERQHYLNRNDLAFSQKIHHRRYTGPRWLGDAFQIPLPPNHFFRMYIDDNRAEGQFRVRVCAGNEPPRQGGERKPHAMTVFMDRGFKSSMHAVDSFTLEAREGTQIFEVFGHVLDYPGVDPAPIPETEDKYGTRAHFHYRFISVQNCSPLKSKFDTPVKNEDWVIHGHGHLVRADDQWIDAWGEDFGKENWLRRSHAGAQHPTRGTPSVFKEVMQDTSSAVIERIEFDLPWQWPPQSVQPFLHDGKLTSGAIRTGVQQFAEKAWRRPLTNVEQESLDQTISAQLNGARSLGAALRDLLATVTIARHPQPNLRVMTFNILQGGEEAKNVGFDDSFFDGSRFDELAEVIQLARADVVGVQEDCSSAKLLQALGDDWERVGSVYSRLPMKKVSVEPYLTTVELQLPGGRSVKLVNCHWFPPRNGYGPDLAQAELRANPGLPDATAAAKRVAEKCAVPNGARGYNATLKPLRETLEAGESVILTGDFNEPSHLDWTENYARHGADRWVGNPTGTPLRFAVLWPGSQALEALRMHDSYRAVRSDEVKDPGITWTPNYPEKTPGRRPYSEQCLDRIDRVYHGGAQLTPISAQVVGESNLSVDLIYPGRWPSDHRAVVVEFEVR